MSTSATGQVHDEAGDGLPDVTVVLEEISNVLDRELGRQTTDSSGKFNFTYVEAYHEPLATPRQFRLRVRIGQHILIEQQIADISSATLTVPPIQILKFESTSRLATLGTGKVSRFTTGNAITWRPDNVDAWGHVAAMLRNAQSTIDLMQLVIDVQPFIKALTTQHAEVVLDFNPPISPPPPIQVVGGNDASYGRIESLLLDASKKPNMAVRIQLPVPVIDLNALKAVVEVLLAEAVLAAGGAGLIAAGASMASLWAFPVMGLGVILLFAATIGFFVLLHVGIDRREGPFNFLPWDHIADWLKAAGALNVEVRPFHTQLFSVTHTKLLLVDGEALLLGSPFEQGYFDGRTHLIDQPMRGNVTEEGPIHDMSISVKGPATGYLQEVFNSHWNLADPSDPRADPPPIPAPLTSATGAEILASVQVVRTINNAVFKNEPGGEKGCLEAYLRAIHFAKRFIYCENQYFTPDIIRDALIDALTANPNLQLIMVLNVKPDTPFYFGWQKNNIKAIAKQLGGDADKRLGVFTTWSHVAAGNGFAKPRLSKNYIHAKAAIIDNEWATVGSANLEGAALNYYELGHSLQGGDFRNTETNCVIYDPDSTQMVAVDALRVNLWAEHLGLAQSDHMLDDIVGRDFLALWKERAELKRLALISSPNVPTDPHVLAWPLDVGDNNVKAHLKALKVPRDPFDVLDDGPRSFDFSAGDWKK